MERAYAAEVAQRLGVKWQLEDHESPDFLVAEGLHRFGLEVTQIHIGPKTRKGSTGRLKESANQQWLQGIRYEFESKCPVLLHVRYRGAASDAARASVVQSLLAEDFASRPVLHRRVWRWSGASLYATRALRPVWAFINDRVGWVSSDGSYLQRGIDEKVAKLPVYRALCADIRLLVVADRTLNSGKLVVSEDFRPDLRGFDAVYFFSYPMTVTCWSRCDAKGEG